MMTLTLSTPRFTSVTRTIQNILDRSRKTSSAPKQRGDTLLSCGKPGDSEPRVRQPACVTRAGRSESGPRRIRVHRFRFRPARPLRPRTAAPPPQPRTHKKKKLIIHVQDDPGSPRRRPNRRARPTEAPDAQRTKARRRARPAHPGAGRAFPGGGTDGPGSVPDIRVASESLPGQVPTRSPRRTRIRFRRRRRRGGARERCGGVCRPVAARAECRRRGAGYAGGCCRPGVGVGGGRELDRGTERRTGWDRGRGLGFGRGRSWHDDARSESVLKDRMRLMCIGWMLIKDGCSLRIGMLERVALETSARA
jgi:hypothetical protein